MYLAQTSKDVREVDDRIAIVVHLMEYKVTEKFDDISEHCTQLGAGSKRRS